MVARSGVAKRCYYTYYYILSALRHLFSDFARGESLTSQSKIFICLGKWMPCFNCTLQRSSWKLITLQEAKYPYRLHCWGRPEYRRCLLCIQTIKSVPTIARGFSRQNTAFRFSGILAGLLGRRAILQDAANKSHYRSGSLAFLVYVVCIPFQLWWMLSLPQLWTVMPFRNVSYEYLLTTQSDNYSSLFNMKMVHLNRSLRSNCIERNNWFFSNSGESCLTFLNLLGDIRSKT